MDPGEGAPGADEPPLTDRLTEALGRVVRCTVRPRFAAMVEQRAGAPLDRSGYLLLGLLEEGPSRVNEMAERLGLDASTVSRQAAGLEESGLLRREPHPTDRRGSVLVISESGKDLLMRHRYARRAIFAELLADLDADTVGRTVTVLDRLAHDLERVERTGNVEP